MGGGPSGPQEAGFRLYPAGLVTGIVKMLPADKPGKEVPIMTAAEETVVPPAGTSRPGQPAGGASTTTAHAGQVTVSAELKQGYQFLVDFGTAGTPSLLMDEPEPLGEGQGPNASRLLAAAVASCLSASLLFCLRKARVDVLGMRSEATATLVRDPRGRLRVGAVRVRLHPDVDKADSGRIARCLELFEDFCIVTQSVRSGLEVSVEVEPASHG